MANMLPTVPGATGERPEPNPRESQDRGFFRFIN
ncbi:MAG: hypothetical protein CM15mP34_1240 [Gammaproteobacteria bacterium]|nr:MAG: hypothetical protein CM15mP34_1240 [Gammaproteobacteria bacterium]